MPNQLRVLGWTPAAEAGFEVVVLLHGWAAAVNDGVQVRVLCALATAGTCHAHAMLIAIFTILAFGSTARDVAIFSRVLQPKRAPAAAGIAGIQGTLPSPKTGRWKSLDAWLTPRLTIVPVAESDSDSGHNGDSHKHGGHSNNHSRIHNHSPSHATSTDTRRGAVGLSGHRPAMGGLLAVSEGVWNTEPVGPSARELGEISLDDPPGVEMVATRWPPSSPPSPPSPRSTGPGHPGYAAPLLE